MNLHSYPASPLTEGWDCTYCGTPLGDSHLVNPADPDGTFCRPACAETWALREARKRTSNPRQVGLAL